MKRYQVIILLALLSQFMFAQKAITIKPELNVEKVYNEDALDTKPGYPSGKKAYQRFVLSNINFSKINKNIDGTIIIRFIIQTNGTATDFTILENPGYGIGEETLRVVKKINMYWKPGILNGKKVPSYHDETFTISIKS